MTDGVETEAARKAKVNLLIHEGKVLALEKAAFPSSKVNPNPNST